jgi:hypothetical protein
MFEKVFFYSYTEIIKISKTDARDLNNTIRFILHNIILYSKTRLSEARGLMEYQMRNILKIL